MNDIHEIINNVFLSGNDKQEQFHKELKLLLKKYDAEIAIEDFGYDYSSDKKIVVDFNWDEDLSNRINDGHVPQLVLGIAEDGRQLSDKRNTTRKEHTMNDKHKTTMAERFKLANANADIGLQLANEIANIEIYGARIAIMQVGTDIETIRRNTKAIREFIIAVSVHIDTLDPDHVISRRWAQLVQEVSQ